MQEEPLIKYGRKLREYRERVGLTQEKAALRIGVSKTSLRNWESGRKIPSVTNLNCLCTVYGISGDDVHVLDGLALMSRKELVGTLYKVLNPDDFG